MVLFYYETYGGKPCVEMKHVQKAALEKFLSDYNLKSAFPDDITYLDFVDKLERGIEQFMNDAEKDAVDNFMEE